MKRNGLTLRRKTSVSQKYPDHVCAAKLVSYVLRVRRLPLHNYMLQDIFAMDETPELYVVKAVSCTRTARGSAMHKFDINFARHQGK